MSIRQIPLPHRLWPLLLLLAFAGCGGGASDLPAPATTPAPVTPTPPADSTTPPPQTGAAAIKPYEPEFEDLFSLDQVRVITIGMTTSEWNALLTDFDANPRNEIFRKADFFYGDSPGDGEFLANVGFRLRGNVFTRERPETGAGAHRSDNRLRRVHFRIKFNEQFQQAEDVYGSPEIATHAENKNREFRTLRSLNLKYNKNDPSYTREVYSYNLFRRFGVQSLRQAYVRLYLRIGAEPLRYMGLYLLGEHVDKRWAQRRFERNGFVFKSLYQGHGPADLSRGDRDHSAMTGRIGSEDTDPDYRDAGFVAYRPAYDLKTRRTDFELAEAALNDLIDLLAGNPARESLERAIDVPALLRAQAVNVFLGNWDDYWRNGNNYYLVQDRNRDMWVFVPYDYDIAMFDRIFMFDGIASASFMNWGDDRLSGTPALMQKVLSFAEWRQLYVDYLRELLAGDDAPGSVAAVMREISAQQALIAPYTSGYDAIDRIPFSRDLGEIRDFVTRRLETAAAELSFGPSASGASPAR